MKTEITGRLREIEQSYKIKIIYAAESGSRAWGFPSADSDFDVRFIYMHQPEWYISVQSRKDTIEFPVTDNLDFSGWDIRKTLEMMSKGNSVLTEWLHSPVVYYSADTYADELSELSMKFWSPVSATYHYLSMAKKYRSLVDSDESRTLKNYFYALRTSFAAMWIADKQNFPPVSFPDMLQLIRDDVNLVSKIRKMILMKEKRDEIQMYPSDPMLNHCIDRFISIAGQGIRSLKKSTGNIEEIDVYFQKLIFGK
jgi:uncharacterized protein